MVSLLEGRGIRLALGGSAILRDVDVEIGEGEVVGLIGPNGAGKTTLVKVLGGLMSADAGRIEWQGEALSTRSERDRAKTFAYLAQGAPAHWPLQVEKVVALGRIPHQAWWQSNSEADIAAIESAIELAEIGHLRHRVVTTLSGGERTRVLLARIFATRPRVILADEPVASLDPYHQLRVMALLRRHALAGGSVLVVLHDLNLAARFCDRLVLLHEGDVIDSGPPQPLLAGELINRAFGLRVTPHEIDKKYVLTYDIDQ